MGVSRPQRAISGFGPSWRLAPASRRSSMARTSCHICAYGNDEGVHQVSVMLGCDKPPLCLPAQSLDMRDMEGARFAFRGLRG